MRKTPVALHSANDADIFFCSVSGKKVRKARDTTGKSVTTFVCEPCICSASKDGMRAYIEGDPRPRLTREEAVQKAVSDTLNVEAEDIPESFGADICEALGVDKDFPSNVSK